MLGARTRQPSIALCAGWPLLRRLGLVSVPPGGVDGSGLLLRGLNLTPGDRVVDLTPGDGSTARRARRGSLHAWTGVVPSAGAARSLAARTDGYGAAVAVGSPDRTGLPDGSATVVMAEGLLSGLGDQSKTAVLREAARVLRPGGRVGLHEIAVTGAGAEDLLGTLRGRAGGGLRPLTIEGWRALVAASGLEVVGVATTPLMIPGPREVIGALGPRRGVEALLAMVRPGGPGGRVRGALTQIARAGDRLTGVVVVAQRPVVGSLRGTGAARTTAEV